ncbi:phosphoserine phosphatase 1 [Microbacteriaceae bacterium 4G12]
MSTKLYITRHGETEWNVAKRMQGRKNSSLTEKGVAQALQLGERMNEIHLDVIYTSPSERAVHTARLIKGERELSIIQDERFYEIDMGNFEGLNFEEIQTQYPTEFETFWNQPHMYRPMVGETFEDVQKRVLNGLEDLLQKHKGESVLIVAHAVAAKLLVGHFTNRPIGKVWDDPFMHGASLSFIEIHNEESKVHLFADTSHFKAKV